jgi:hypothetical protein
MMPDNNALTSVYVASWLLWPLGLCLLVILVQVVFLLYGVLDCLTLLRYELLPALKDVRLTAAHVQDMSGRASSGVHLLEKGINTSRHGVSAFLSGVKRSFNQGL